MVRTGSAECNGAFWRPAAAALHRLGFGVRSADGRAASALDPIATARIEELIHELKTDLTVVVVTRMQQAARVSSHTAFLYMGELIEYDKFEITNRRCRRTELRDWAPGEVTMTLHTDREYEADLQALRQHFLRIGGLVEQMIGNALQATFDRNEELALQVAESDKEVNRSELEVDELCLKVLALRQPAASDLRFVTFALKAITDLERIGDLAVNG